MSVIFKKKIVYYLLIMLTLFFMCLRGDLLVEDGFLYSVLDVIRGLAGDRSSNVVSAFDAGVALWMYLLLPIASIPFVSFLSEERKSGYHLFEKQRKGSLWYLSTRVVFAFVSSAVILFVVIVAYAAVVYHYFEIDEVSGGMLFCKQVFSKYAYMQMYSFSLSCPGAWFVYVYNDLYVDMSLVLVLNYIFRNTFLTGKLVYPLAVLVVTVILYAVVRKLRCDKI